MTDANPPTPVHRAIAADLKARGMGAEEFGQRCSLPRLVVDRLLEGRVRIDDDLARNLQRVLGTVPSR